MKDVNQIVGELRVFVQSVDRTEQPRMATLASDYAAACTEVNERLNRCAAFLRQGLRSEAIHLAKTDPDLLDMVAILDFAERAEWDEIALTSHWPKAPALAIEAAQAINEAYALEHPLEDLLRTHRRLALTRAPIQSRLETMRKLARLDAGNPIWTEDIGRFERARLDEIQAEIRAARGYLDEVALAQLVQELETTEWLVPLPESLLAGAREANTHAKREDARGELRALLEPLHRARASKDATRGRQLRAHWLGLIEGASLPTHDPLFGQVQAVMDWLEQEDRREKRECEYHETLENLEQALADNRGRGVLEALEQEAHGLGRGLPKELQAQLQERYRTLRGLERRRNHIAIAVVAATCLVLIGLVIRSKTQQERSRDLRTAAANIESLLDSEKPEQARNALSQLEQTYPDASADDLLSAVHDRLVTWERKEDERKAKFHAALSEAQGAFPTEVNARALEAARLLARLPDEKAKVESIASTHRAFREHEQTKVDQKLLPNLQAFKDRLKKLESSAKPSFSSSETRDELVELRGEIPRLRNVATTASDELKRQVEVCIKSFNTFDNTCNARIEQDEYLSKMIQSAGSINRMEDLKQYLSSCQRYIEKFPTGDRTSSLRKALDEQFRWESTVAWRTMIASWPPAVVTLDPKDADQRMKQMDLFRTTYPEGPVPPPFESYHRYVESIARLATRDQDNPAKQLQKLYSNPLVENLWRIRNRNGKTYYSLENPSNGEAGCHLLSLIDDDCHVKQVFILNRNLNDVVQAPQSQFAGRLKPLLARPVDSETAWILLIGNILKALHQEQDIDPILKIGLLKGTIQVASAGNALLESALDDHARMIEDAQINLKAAWMDPEDRNADAERRRAMKALRGLPPFDSYGKAVEDERQRLASELRQSYRPIGLLLRDDEGIWRCRTSAPIPPNEELFVLVPEALVPEAAWRKVGKKHGADDGHSIDQTAPELLEGRLIFLRDGSS